MKTLCYYQPEILLQSGQTIFPHLEISQVRQVKPFKFTVVSITPNQITFFMSSTVTINFFVAFYVVHLLSDDRGKILPSNSGRILFSKNSFTREVFSSTQNSSPGYILPNMYIFFCRHNKVCILFMRAKQLAHESKIYTTIL